VLLLGGRLLIGDTRSGLVRSSFRPSSFVCLCAYRHHHHHQQLLLLLWLALTLLSTWELLLDLLAVDSKRFITHPRVWRSQEELFSCGTCCR
jgi:hypothetical protein